MEPVRTPSPEVAASAQPAVAAPAAAAAARLPPSQLSFDTLCRFWTSLRKVRGRWQVQRREAMVKRFLEANVLRSSRDAFCLLRLMLPDLDTHRGNYQLLEYRLARALAGACQLHERSSEARAVLGWRRPGRSSAGNFAEVLREQLFESFCGQSPGVPAQARTLKICQLNERLDALAAAAGDMKRQAETLRGLMMATTPEQMAYIVQIVLKDLKINCREKTLLKCWHPDAFNFFNSSGMDLKVIFNEMIDEAQRHSVAIWPGRAVNPQLATASNSPEYVAEAMAASHGGRFLLETKFDGERVQLHRHKLLDGSGGPDLIGYYSRNMIEHGACSAYSLMDEVIRRATAGPCILDGELIAWDKRKASFVSFGSVKPLITAIREGKGADERLEFDVVDDERAAAADQEYQPPLLGDCELVYVVFDILHNGASALNMEPLETRLRLLRQFVRSGESVPLGDAGAVCGRVEVMVPGMARLGGRLACPEGATAHDIRAALEEAQRQGEEGVVVKALDSHWTPANRSSRWFKFKPDYFRSLELDPVIIGAWYGTGRRGNVFSQYLLALGDALDDTGEPTKWVSFCKVGTGLTDQERREVHDLLHPLCTEGPPPPCYEVTGQAAERPDVWVQHPARSFCLEVKGDLRAIHSRVFATGQSVRFPTVERIRLDKSGRQCSSVAELKDWVASQREHRELAGRNELERLHSPTNGRRKRKWGRRDGEGPRSKVQVIGYAQLADVSQVAVESKALAGCCIHFLHRQGYNKAELAELEAAVKRLGGTTSAMPVHSTTHILASPTACQSSEVARLRQKDRDVVRLSWLQECIKQRRRVTPSPRYHVHRSRASIKADPAVDSFGDPFLSDLGPDDAESLLARVLRPGQVSLDQLAASLAQSCAFDDTPAELQAQAGLRAQPASREALAAYIDAQLASVGRLDRRFTALRLCTVALLRLGRGSEGEGGPIPASNGNGSGSRAKQEQQEAGGSSAGEAQLFPCVRRLVQQGQQALSRLQEAQAATAAAEVRLMGGSVAPALTKQVTHIVGIALPRQEAVAGLDGGRALRPASVAPPAVLRAVAEQQGGGGAAAATLHLGLGSGNVRLLSDGWVHACLGRAESGAADLPPEDGFSLTPTDPGSLQAWPWDLYPTEHPSSPKPGIAGPLPAHPASRRRGTATAAPHPAHRLLSHTPAQGFNTAAAMAGGQRSRSAVAANEPCWQRFGAGVPSTARSTACHRHCRCLTMQPAFPAFLQDRAPIPGIPQPATMLTAVHPGPATSLSLGQSFAAGRGTITVGRLEHNVLSAIQMNMAAGLQLPEKLVNMVSRQHARLEVVAGHLQLVDLGAVNGTYVNDQRLEGGSTRVLQDNDVVSFGGPISIALRGGSRPNPWVWRVRDLQQFLASYVPPGQEPPSASASPAAAATAGQLEPPPREVFRFSPGPPVAGGVPHQPLAAAPAVAEAAEEEVVSPVPVARAGNGQPGSMPVRESPPSVAGAADEAAGAAGVAADDSDDSAALDLAALEAYIATQQASNPAAGGAAAAANTGAQPAPPAPLLPGAMPVQGAAQQGAAQMLLPGAMPVQGVMQQAAAPLLPPGAMPVQAAPQVLPPGAMPVQSTTQALWPVAAAPAAQPAAGPRAAQPGPAAQQPAQQAGARPARPAPLCPAPEPELVDLTADSPSPVSAGRRQAQQQQQALGRAGRGGSAAGAGPEGVEYVDLASPTKRRHGSAEQEAQEAKRARPSPEAHLQPRSSAEASRPSAPAVAAAAAGAGAAAAAAAAVGPDLSSMHQELTCAICQEMLVATHNMYPCNHPFCGDCLAGWLGKGKRECPTCRVKGTAAPVRAHQMDNIISMIAKSLPSDDQESRQEKLQSWEANRERLERELAAPWAGSSGGSGRDRGAGSGSGRGSGGGGADIYGLAAAILGGGGPLAALGAPFFIGGGPELLYGGAPGGGGGGGNRRGAAAPRRAPPPPQAPLRHDFRVEVSPQLSTARCATCGSAIGEHVTRIGMRQAGAARRGGGYQWHHLVCLPAAHYREAAERGVEGLRGVPARDQAFVRERMRPPR
ncbi:hypothetical protein ABPG75_003150 [Micractinium tetrahymenae]